MDNLVAEGAIARDHQGEFFGIFFSELWSLENFRGKTNLYYGSIRAYDS